MARPQFTLRTLLVAMLVVGAFFGGIKFERQRHQGADEAAAKAARRMQRGTRSRIINKGGFEFVVNTEEERAALAAAGELPGGERPDSQGRRIPG
jgi:hypothetical protein